MCPGGAGGQLVQIDIEERVHLDAVGPDMRQPDPELAGVLALHVGSAGENGIPLDRLPGEGLARRDPVA